MAYLELVKLIPRFCGCHFPISHVGKLNQDVAGGSLPYVVIADKILIRIQVIVHEMQRISACRRSSHNCSEEVGAAMRLQERELVCRVNNKALVEVLMHLRKPLVVVSCCFAHGLDMCWCTPPGFGGFVPIGTGNSRQCHCMGGYLLSVFFSANEAGRLPRSAPGVADVAGTPPNSGACLLADRQYE